VGHQLVGRDQLVPPLHYSTTPPPHHLLVAVIRLAWVGLERTRFTVIPGFKSAKVALWPFTMISVNCVAVTVLVDLSSVMVMLLPKIEEITMACGVGAGVAFFFPFAIAGAVKTNIIITGTINCKRRDVFISVALLALSTRLLVAPSWEGDAFPCRFPGVRRKLSVFRSINYRLLVAS
jgi:hypothetical protein